MNKKYEIDKKAAQVFKDTLSHYIYVQPNVFSFLQTLSIALPVDVKDFDWDTHYLVTTKQFHSKNRNNGFVHFITDKTTANAIKKLLRNNPQYMFPDKKGLPFNAVDSILTIKGIPFILQRDDERFQICKLLFGDTKTFGKQWEHDEFISQYKDTDEIDNLYTYLYHKIRHLNKDINDQAGVDRLILVEKKTIGINPIYISLFLD